VAVESTYFLTGVDVPATNVETVQSEQGSATPVEASKNWIMAIRRERCGGPGARTDGDENQQQRGEREAEYWRVFHGFDLCETGSAILVRNFRRSGRLLSPERGSAAGG